MINTLAAVGICYICLVLLLIILTIMLLLDDGDKTPRYKKILTYCLYPFVFVLFCPACFSAGIVWLLTYNAELMKGSGGSILNMIRNIFKGGKS